MKIEQEFLLLKNIARFSSGQKITGVTVFTADAVWVLDLLKAPEWFKPIRSTFVPKKGEEFFYIDENLEVRVTKLSDDPENLAPTSPDAKKLVAGNFYENIALASRARAALSETHLRNQEIGAADQVEKAEETTAEIVKVETKGGLG